MSEVNYNSKGEVYKDLELIRKFIEKIMDKLRKSNL